MNQLTQNLPSRTVASRSPRFVIMFCTLAVLFGLGQFHRSGGSVLSPVVGAEFALAPGLVGVVFGGLFLAQGLAQLPAGISLDRFGARWTIPGITLAAVLGCFVIAAATSWQALLAGRILIGLGFSAALMGTMSVVSNWAPREAVATLMGRFMFVGMLGGILATSPFAYAIEQYGWRMTFVGLGLVTLAAVVVSAAIVRDAPSEVAPVRTQPPETVVASMRGLVSVVRVRRFWPILTVAPFLYAPNQVLLGLWAGPYLKDVHGLDAITRGHALSAMVVAMAVGFLVYGPVERRVRSKRWVVVSGAMCVGVAFLGLALVGGWQPLLAIAFCVLAILASTFFVIVLAHAQGLFPREYASRVLSVVGLLAITGIFCSQVLTALLLTAFPGAAGATASEAGYRAMFALLAAASFAVALIYRLARED